MIEALTTNHQQWNGDDVIFLVGAIILIGLVFGLFRRRG
jgi:hypothetical protein